MLKLSELKISPAPWSVTKNNLGSDDVTAKDSTIVVAYEPPFEEAKDSINRRLIAAAPLMYEALLEMVEMYRDGGSYDYEQEVITKAKAALAKASGESEVTNA